MRCLTASDVDGDLRDPGPCTDTVLADDLVNGVKAVPDGVPPEKGGGTRSGRVVVNVDDA